MPRLSNTERAAQYIAKWIATFGFAHYEIVVRPQPKSEWGESWARSLWQHHEEFVIFEFCNDVKLNAATLETLTLHEIAHGLTQLQEQLGEGGEELAVNRIARIVMGGRASMVNQYALTTPNIMPDGKDWRLASHLRPEMRVWLQPVMEDLPERERHVIDGLYYRGLSFREVGLELGCSKRTILRLKRKALARIRTQLEHLDGVL